MMDIKLKKILGTQYIVFLKIKSHWEAWWKT